MSTAPPLNLPHLFSSGDPLPVFEIIKVESPSQSHPVRISPDTISRLREDFWYGNMGSDDVFEYRAVEVPLEIALQCPNRNLTEFECRSIGITQSKGWVNYFRNSAEKNVFLFRRAHSNIEQTEITHRTISELKNSINCIDAVIASGDYEVLKEFLIFPMHVFDSELIETGFENQIEISSAKSLADWQRVIFLRSLELTRN
jgi:cyclin-dependent kinase regulatory subunit CKS1